MTKLDLPAYTATFLFHYKNDASSLESKRLKNVKLVTFSHDDTRSEGRIWLNTHPRSGENLYYRTHHFSEDVKTEGFNKEEEKAKLSLTAG